MLTPVDPETGSRPPDYARPNRSSANPTRTGVLQLVAGPLIVVLLAAGTVLASSAPASAGTPGQNPAACGNPSTWRFQDFNVSGWVFRLELRHSYQCGTVGWARLSRIGGSGPALAVIPSVWNPNQPSQGGVPNTNYTYTVDARPGRQVCGGFQAYWIDNAGRWNHIGWFFAGCYWG